MSLDKTSITPAELKQWLDEGKPFIVLDVRNDEEFARVRIPDRPTVHIPYFVAIEDPDGFVAEVEQQIPKDAFVVAVCAKGDSSAWIADEFLRPRGYTIVNLEGGMDAWEQFLQSASS